MLQKIRAINFFHKKCLGRTNIKCQNVLVLPPAQVLKNFLIEIYFSKVNYKFKI
jgi:hypothetical protein